MDCMDPLSKREETPSTSLSYSVIGDECISIGYDGETYRAKEELEQVDDILRDQRGVTIFDETHSVFHPFLLSFISILQDFHDEECFSSIERNSLEIELIGFIK